MSRGGVVSLAAALCVLLLGGLAWRRAEGDAPGVAAPDSLGVGREGARVSLELSDAGSGLRSVSVTLRHAGGEAELFRADYPGGWLEGALSRAPLQIDVAVDSDALDLPHGDAVLEVLARDWSWRGNETRLDLPVRIDLEPPRIRVASGLTYVRRGGAGAVRYELSEPGPRDGVELRAEGEALAFYPGFPAQGPGQRIALFAVPADAPAGARAFVVAEDAVGNRSAAPWPVVVQPRALRDSQVTLPQGFLDAKVGPLARAAGIPTDDLTAAFQTVNSELRAENEARVRELLSRPHAAPLWRGAFQQLPGSQVTSRFAEHRIYYVGPQRVSEATHFGFDLASTAAAPVGAANAGRVVFAGDLGIYGQCVLIDHGQGLASLYGHLSRLDARAGDLVSKGQTLGLSGATGLAGGDHLHFAMLVGETYVDPVEWWDAKWVRTHIDARLSPSSE